MSSNTNLYCNVHFIIKSSKLFINLVEYYFINIECCDHFDYHLNSIYCIMYNIMQFSKNTNVKSVQRKFIIKYESLGV